MKLEVLKNKETSLAIDDVGRVIEEEGFLAKGYNKAIDALTVYIQQTREIRREVAALSDRRSEVNNKLYQSPQNIIAFAGKRGTGKTSSMISFSEFLEKPAAKGSHGEKIKKDRLPGLRVTALSPLDPTMLENGQDILSVVLSRLLYKAEERWEGGDGFYGGHRGSEEEKNKLLKTGNACMNGITAIKKKGEMKSLADLQRIGDSAVLKKNLYDFVNQVITFCMDKDEKSSCSDYLVIPIDDTDCQIGKAYEVMEDIRRYLTLPNVIILMATDMELLRTVVAQHFAEEFKVGIDRSFRTKEEMEQFAEKYITKLIPTTHRIYLPSFEAVLQEHSDRLEFGYYEDEKRDKDLITGTTAAKRAELKEKGEFNCLDFNFQAKVLYYIYKQTGVFFSEHTSYINNIIPTTMRGLSHMLSLLKPLDAIEQETVPDNVTTRELVKIVETQLDRKDASLDAFKEYFMKEWVPTKLSGDMVRFLGALERQVPEKRIQFAFDRFYGTYIISDKDKNEDKRLKEKDREDKKQESFSYSNDVKYYYFMTMLSAINGTISSVNLPKVFNSMADYYNVMAVRILFTIKNNKQAIKIKRQTIRDINEELKKNEDTRLIFELNALGDDDSFPRINVRNGASGDTDGTKEYEHYLAPILSVFTRYLNKWVPEQNYSQYEIYKYQELSWLVLCNWDVQDVIYKAVKRYFEEDLKSESKELDLMNYTLDALVKKNCGMLKDYEKLKWTEKEKWPEDLTSLLKSEKEKRLGQKEEAASSQTAKAWIPGEAEESIKKAIEELRASASRGGYNYEMIAKQLNDLEGYIQAEIIELNSRIPGLEDADRKYITGIIRRLRNSKKTCISFREFFTEAQSRLQNNPAYSIESTDRRRMNRFINSLDNTVKSIPKEK